MNFVKEIIINNEIDFKMAEIIYNTVNTNNDEKRYFKI